MKLIPLGKVQIQSSLSKLEVVNLLNENIQQVPSLSIFSVRHKKLFEGTFRNDQFKIVPKINYLNSFVPVFVGGIRGSKENTLIE